MKTWKYVFRKTILCVEDDPVALMSRRMLLSQHGYRVLVALSGDAALRILADTHVDLVITDHFMPGMSGTELVAAMKAWSYNIPTAILTGALDRPEGSELADMVLIKACDPLDFLVKVAQLLRKPESSEESDSSERGRE